MGSGFRVEEFRVYGLGILELGIGRFSINIPGTKTSR